MLINHTKNALQAYADEKFTRFIEDESLDNYNSDEITVLFALFAQKAAEYSADAIDW